MYVRRKVLCARGSRRVSQPGRWAAIGRSIKNDAATKAGPYAAICGARFQRRADEFAGQATQSGKVLVLDEIVLHNSTTKAACETFDQLSRQVIRAGCNCMAMRRGSSGLLVCPIMTWFKPGSIRIPRSRSSTACRVPIPGVKDRVNLTILHMLVGSGKRGLTGAVSRMQGTDRGFRGGLAVRSRPRRLTRIETGSERIRPTRSDTCCGGGSEPN